MLDSTTDSIFLLDFDGNFIYVNEPAYKTRGYSKNEIMDINLYDLIVPEFVDLTKSHIDNLMKKTPAYFESAHRCKDGTLINVDINSRIVESDDEKLVLLTCRDITQHIKAEKNLLKAQSQLEKTLEKRTHELRESEERFEQIARSAGEWIWEVDANGKYTYSSPVIEDLLGYKIEEIVGKKYFYDLYPPDEKKELKRLAMESFKGKEPFKGFINTCTHKNGTKVVLETKGTPILGNEGELLGYRGADTDITERYQAARKLAKSEEHLRFITDNMTDVIGLVDPKGIITYFSPSLEELTGFQPRDILGKNAFDLVHPDHREKLAETIKKTIKDQMPAILEYKTLKSDGGYLWVETIGKAVYDYSGRYKYLVFTVRDISTRKKAEKSLLKAHAGLEKKVEERTLELTEANKLLQSEIAERQKAEEQIKKSLKEKEMLLKEIHHRVKNNLTIISSLLGLQSRYTIDEASRGMFKESQNRARSMALIHQSLYQSVDLKKIDFGSYIKILSDQLLRTYARNLKTIKLYVNAEDVFLDVNTAIPLGLIANELITNSLKYAFPDNKSGIITVDFHSKDDRYEFAVKDNGVGLNDELNIQDTSSLGLQIVNTLTRQINGEIRLDREEGTAFIITFKETEIS